MRRNIGPGVGLVVAALFLVRYLVVRDRGLGLSHGSARLVTGVVVLFALAGIRLFARRR